MRGAFSKTSLAAAAVLVAAIGGKAALHANGPTAPAAGVSEYARQDLPDGPGKDEIQRLCSVCHDLIFTMTKREDEAGWTRIVNDMRSKGADGTEEEFAQVIAYLTAHMGKSEPEGHATLELVANRTKVAPGERFAFGLRLTAADGWRLKEGTASGQPPQLSWTVPQAVSIDDSARPVTHDPAKLSVFPAVVSMAAAAGSTIDVTARVAYEVCRETCLPETATASMTLPVGDGGTPSHDEEFAHAGAASMPR